MLQYLFHLKAEQLRQFLDAMNGQFLMWISSWHEKCSDRKMKMRENNAHFLGFFLIFSCLYFKTQMFLLVYHITIIYAFHVSDYCCFIFRIVASCCIVVEILSLFVHMFVVTFSTMQVLINKYLNEIEVFLIYFFAVLSTVFVCLCNLLYYR